MWTCIAHAGYFAVAAVLMTFLHFPAFSRAVLLLSVPLNAVAEVNQQPALDLGSLSLLLLALSLGTTPKRLSRAIQHSGWSLRLLFGFCSALVCPPAVGELQDTSCPAAARPG